MGIQKTVSCFSKTVSDKFHDAVHHVLGGLTTPLFATVVLDRLLRRVQVVLSLTDEC